MCHIPSVTLSVSHTFHEVLKDLIVLKGINPLVTREDLDDQREDIGDQRIDLGDRREGLCD